jgi:hypothetical protein
VSELNSADASLQCLIALVRDCSSPLYIDISHE